MSAMEPLTGRRLQPLSAASNCGGRLFSTHLQTTLLHAEIHASLFDANTKHSLWDPKPLVGDVRPGALRLRCPAAGAAPDVWMCRRCADDLQALRQTYAGLHLEPVIRAIRPHNGRRPIARAASTSIALLVLPDYSNLFHQFGSVAIAWAALQESLAVAPPLTSSSDSPDPTSNLSAAALPPDFVAEQPPQFTVSIFMLSNATLTPTRFFWSPGLAAAPPVFVRSLPPPQASAIGFQPTAPLPLAPSLHATFQSIKAAATAVLQPADFAASNPVPGSRQPTPAS